MTKRKEAELHKDKADFIDEKLDDLIEEMDAIDWHSDFDDYEGLTDEEILSDDSISGWDLANFAERCFSRKNADSLAERCALIAYKKKEYSSCYLLGRIYERKASQKFYKKAFDWFMKGAEHGDALSQFMVGVYYCQGNKSVPCNFDTAKFYFKEAAKQGHPTSMFNIAIMYANDGNHDDAHIWFNLSCARGLTTAGKYRDRIEKYMMHEDSIVNLQQRASSWMKKHQKNFRKFICENTDSNLAKKYDKQRNVDEEYIRAQIESQGEMSVSALKWLGIGALTLLGIGILAG